MGKVRNAALTLLFSSLSFMSAYASTLHVNAGGSISNAVMNASPGDTIVVGKGLYKEHVVINKSLILRGLDFPVIDGSLQGSVITVSSDNVKIEGFKVIRSGRSSLRDYCGILVKDSHGISIVGNIMRSNQFSIMLQNCNNSIIANNSVESDIREMQVMGNAIHCWKSDHLKILNNIVGHNRDGIYLEFVYDSFISGNKVNGCERYGLHFMFSHHNTYTHNHFSHNLAGVAVMYTHDVNMNDNVFEQSKGGASYGLLLKEINGGQIRNNIFRNNSVAILMDGGTDLHINHNIIRENGWGMRVVASSTGDVIEGNDFVGNTFDVSTNSSYNANAFDGNYWDKYDGYDLNRDGHGDVPYHPLSLFSTLAEQNEGVLMFYRSFIMNLLDAAEKVMPTLTPDNYVDNRPCVKPNVTK